MYNILYVVYVVLYIMYDKLIDTRTSIELLSGLSICECVLGWIISGHRLCSDFGVGPDDEVDA